MFKTATAAVKNFEGAPEQTATVKSITQPSAPMKDEDTEQDYRNNTKIVAEVTRAFGLLATPPGGWVYQDLYNAARLPKLFGQLFTAAMSIYSLSPQPVLNIALSAGLSSLKVPACYGGERKDSHGAKSTPALSAGLAIADMNGEAAPNTTPSMPGVGEVDEDLMRDVRREVRAENDKHRQQVHSTVSSEEADDGGMSNPDETRNLNCPVCATIKLTKAPHTRASSSLVDGLGLGTLAKEIPWSHHSNSTIVCRISGRVIDEGSEEGEGGQAVALPNGRVYSKRVSTSVRAHTKDVPWLTDGASTSIFSPLVQALETYSASLDDGAAAARKRRNEGKAASQAFVTCPRTRDRFFTGQMRRVYIS
jgi:macrophage erythroblast attacher